MVGERRAGVGPAEGPLWAADGARGALEWHGPTRVRVLFISALPAHAVRCSVRVSCSTNFLLHEGMLVVCVRVRHFFTSPPPSYVIAFTMEPGQRDRLRSRVCSDWHRILTGTCARVVRWCPSRRRWKRSKCASVRGPGAKRGAPDRSLRKKSSYQTPYYQVPVAISRISVGFPLPRWLKVPVLLRSRLRPPLARVRP